MKGQKIPADITPLKTTEGNHRQRQRNIRLHRPNILFIPKLLVDQVGMALLGFMRESKLPEGEAQRKGLKDWFRRYQARTDALSQEVQAAGASINL